MALVKPNYHFSNGFVFENKFNPVHVDNGIITINYLLSSKCQLNCGYCIAKDIIKNYAMPSLEQVDGAIDTILELDPLVTALTGGEPMLSPHLKHVIERLYGHTNIMLDTNGLLLLNSDLNFFREHNVTIRISVDILGNKNCLVRPKLTEEPYNIVDVINYMNEKGYPFVVSTVISNYNAELLPLQAGIYCLYYPTVMGWRLQDIIDAHDNDLTPYTINPETGALNDFKENKIKTLDAIEYIDEQNWTDKQFSIQICLEEQDHSAIMILPDGSIAVSNKSQNTRETLTIEELRKKINDDNHAKRYVLK